MKQKNNSHIFFLAKKNDQPSIENVVYPASVSIPLIDEIYDAKADTNRVIRYVPGETSIYLDEQRVKDKVKTLHLEFVNGMRVVEDREKTLYDFLRVTNMNRAAKNRNEKVAPIFYEYMPGVGAEEAIKREEEIMEAKGAVYALDLPTLLSVARSANIPVDRDPREIRYTLGVQAEKDPQRFMRILRSPNTSRKNAIMSAIDENVLTHDKKSKTIRWAKTEQAIITAPVGVDTIDFLVDFTFSVDGEIFLKELIKATSKEKEAFAKLTAEESPDQKVLKMDADELLDSAVRAGIIEKNGTWFIFETEKLGQKAATKEKLEIPAFAQEIRRRLIESMKEQEA